MQSHKLQIKQQMPIHRNTIIMGWLIIWAIAWMISLFLPAELMVFTPVLFGMANVSLLWRLDIISWSKKTKSSLIVGSTILLVYGIGSVILEATCRVSETYLFIQNAGFCLNRQLDIGLVLIVIIMTVIGTMISSFATFIDARRGPQ